MSQVDVDSYRSQAKMIEFHLGDFTDADMLVRPAEHANHAAWQLGHLVVATANLINACTPGAIPPVDPEFVNRYSKKASANDTGFDPKAELIKRFNDVNELAIKWVQSLSDADRAKPTPDNLKNFAATVGHMVQTLPQHTMMHVGQFQVLRRKLNKPILF